MSNYSRNIRADIWDNRRFTGYNAKQKLFWFYLHTSDATSDTSAFRLRLSRAADTCGISKNEAKKIFDGFVADGLAIYDEETEEVLITDYFVYGHEPLSGIGYSYYRKDLKKIESKKILDALCVQAKGVDICEQFFRALADVIPNLKRTDFHIRPPKARDREQNDAKTQDFDAEENALF